ncbi:MAG: MBL fold metallo-hydrolase [Gemmatimonadales bacterium]|nr:MAG: MBL fold metallo-hydrolase [Gemmatimonadales bacterium]
MKLLRTTPILALVALTSCGDSTSDPVGPDPIEIEVSGVEDGAVYGAPVTISWSVSPSGASASGELNGESFTSGSTVSRPGDYSLVIEAVRAGDRAEARVEFSLEITGDRRLIVRMFDLGPEGLGGGGDAILLSDSSSLGIRHGMVDAGPRGDPGPTSGSDPIIRDEYVAEQLLALGVDTLEFLQLTHAHADHFGGMAPILQSIHVREFIYNGQPRNFARYQTVLSAANSLADTVIVLSQEREIRLGGDDQGVRTVHLPGLPDYLSTPTNDGRLLNEGSLGTWVEFEGVRLFLTGDSEVEANQRWRTSFAEWTSNIEILKVGHHGANNAIFDDGFGSSSQQSSWLDHTRPQLMLIPANGRSHPRVRALNRMHQEDQAEVYCTNVHGLIEVRIAGGWWEVTTERNGNADCVPGSEANT